MAFTRETRGWDDPRHRPRGRFGDPEAHSEASRRGWEHGHRGHGYGRDDDDYERGGYRRSRSRYEADDDYDRRGRSRGGWFSDSRGHSEASRRGWDRR